MKQFLTFTVLFLFCLALSNAVSVHERVKNNDVLEALKAIQQDITTLKVDIASVKQDVGSLKQDINTLKVDSATIKQQTAAIKTDTGSVKDKLLGRDDDDDDDNQPRNPSRTWTAPSGPPAWPNGKLPCFGANTNIMMANGSIKKISQLSLGDETLGGTVLSIQVSLRLKAGVYRVKASDSDNAPSVDVTENHAVLNADGSWSRVHASTRSKVKLDESEAKIHQVVYNIDTTQHLIWVEGIKFPFSDYTEVDEDEAEVRMWDAALNQHPPKIDQAVVDAAFVAYEKNKLTDQQLSE